jgi:hypothetical protein
MTRIVRIDNHQLVGRLLIDVGVPHASLPRRSPTMSSSWPTTNCRTGLETAFDNAEGRWTLTRLTGAVIDPDRSLAEVGRWIDEVSSCSRSSQRACAPAVRPVMPGSVTIGRQGCEAANQPAISRSVRTSPPGPEQVHANCPGGRSSLVNFDGLGDVTAFVARRHNALVKDTVTSARAAPHRAREEVGMNEPSR